MENAFVPVIKLIFCNIEVRFVTFEATLLNQNKLQQHQQHHQQQKLPNTNRIMQTNNFEVHVQCTFRWSERVLKNVHLSNDNIDVITISSF